MEELKEDGNKKDGEPKTFAVSLESNIRNETNESHESDLEILEKEDSAPKGEKPIPFWPTIKVGKILKWCNSGRGRFICRWKWARRKW